MREKQHRSVEGDAERRVGAKAALATVALFLSAFVFAISVLLYSPAFMPKPDRTSMTDAGFGGLNGAAFMMLWALPLGGLVGAVLGVFAAGLGASLPGNPGRRRARAAIVLGALSVLMPCAGLSALHVRDQARNRAEAARVVELNALAEKAKHVATDIVADADAHAVFVKEPNLPPELRGITTYYTGGLVFVDELRKVSKEFPLLEVGVHDMKGVYSIFIFLDGHSEFVSYDGARHIRSNCARLREDLGLPRTSHR